MAPFPKKTDMQWRFVGQSVKAIEDLTEVHIRSVYGLGTVAGDNQGKDNGNPRKPKQGEKETVFPYCENRFLDESTNDTRSNTHGSCSPAKCKDSNPHCLNYMGQEDWESEDAQEVYASMVCEGPDPELSSRSSDSPAGMKDYQNLGATCYANSLLQVWFHDLPFRDCIFRSCFNAGSDKEHDALCQLQLLFAFLDQGKRSTYNPQDLVKSLKLDTAIQQDVQEFCNLFMARIDSQLQHQTDKTLHDFVKQKFQGRYVYKTTCKACSKPSIQECTFYELMLNIKDNCTLMDSFEDFVESEELAGDDRYFCSNCNSLQDATRMIELKELPEVMNIQLMRFYYDTATWAKKKSKDKIRFPVTINFKDLLGKNKDAIYDLTAVLVHSGPSAHSGHFMAHVLNTRTKKWHVLNDEEVCDFDSTLFDPEDYAAAAVKSKSKQGKKMSELSESESLLSILSSKNAYMMSYTKRRLDPVKPKLPPKDALDIVLQDNAAYEAEALEYNHLKEKHQEAFARRRTELRAVYRTWHVSKAEDESVYVPSDTISRHLTFGRGVTEKTTESLEPLEDVVIACKHGKLSPLAVSKCKRISKVACEPLTNQGFIWPQPLLTEKDICRVCTTDITKDKLYNIQHRRDVEEFEKKAKSNKSPPAAWISKPWLAEWSKVSPRFHPAHGTSKDDPSPIDSKYRDDVFCQHLSLSSDKTKRKIINKAALDVLNGIFGKLVLPQNNEDDCFDCLDHHNKDLDLKRDLSARAASEKQELSEMVMRGARVRHIEPERAYYLVSHDFMKKWTNYLKKPLHNDRPATINNSSLICSNHGGSLFDLNQPGDMDDIGSFTVVQEEEWLYLQALYQGGPEVVVKSLMSGEGGVADIETSPALCQPCRTKRALDYTAATIFVRVYAPGDPIILDKGLPEIKASSEGEVKSPENESGQNSTKRKSPVLKPESVSRRSKRSKTEQKTFKEHRIFISKLDTVMDLKLKIMQKTKVVPLYQKLLLDERELDNNESTMEELEIVPNTVLNMIAFDQTMQDLELDNLQDVSPVPGEEGGFGGTGLAGEWSF